VLRELMGGTGATELPARLRDEVADAGSAVADRPGPGRGAR